MKRFIISLTLIIIAFSLCFFTSRRVETHADRLQLKLKQAAEIIESGDNDRIEKALNEITEIWNETEKLYSYIVDADKIEQLSADIPLILVHIKDNNKDYAMAKLRESERLFEEIAENEKLNFKNIM